MVNSVSKRVKKYLKKCAGYYFFDKRKSFKLKKVFFELNKNKLKSKISRNQELLSLAIFDKRGCRMSLLKKAFKLGADINEPIFTDGTRALDFAAEWGTEGVSKIWTCATIIKKGADPYKPDKEGYNFAHFAVMSGDVQCCNFALNHFPESFKNKNNMGLNAFEVIFSCVRNQNDPKKREEILNWSWSFSDKETRQNILKNGFEWSLRSTVNPRGPYRFRSVNVNTYDYEWLFMKGAKVDISLMNEILEESSQHWDVNFLYQIMESFFARQTKETLNESMTNVKYESINNFNLKKKTL